MNNEEAEERRNKYYKSTVRRFKIALTIAAEPSIQAYENNSRAFSISSDPITKAYIETYRIVGSEFAKITLRELEKRKDASQDLRPEWLKFMERYTLKEAGKRIKSVLDTTLELVQRTINDSVQEGLGSKETGRNIRKKWGEITKYRSEMIARTEIVSASNMGSIVGARASGLDLNKNWLATSGPRTRDDHAVANGQQVSMDEKFNVGGEDMDFPGDPNASAGNTINCRCSITFEPK